MKGAFVASLILAGGLTACRSLPTTGPTRAALATAGYRVDGLEADVGSDGSHVRVRVTSATAQEGETGTVAGVVWTTMPFRFDELDVAVDGPRGPLTEAFTYAQLADRFGPRLPGLDRRDYRREVTTLTRQLLAGIALPAVAFMVGLGAFVLLGARRPRPGAA
ncbi:MAG: hypothetical protein M3144_12060 [Actinomycetota bacterium]|nr:hypothetical protein [Actinomycetota bacterium]